MEALKCDVEVGVRAPTVFLSVHWHVPEIAQEGCGACVYASVLSQQYCRACLRVRIGYLGCSFFVNVQSTFLRHDHLHTFVGSGARALCLRRTWCHFFAYTWGQLFDLSVVLGNHRLMCQVIIASANPLRVGQWFRESFRMNATAASLPVDMLLQQMHWFVRTAVFH